MNFAVSRQVNSSKNPDLGTRCGNILLRYCRFDTIEKYFPKYSSTQFSLEIEILKETNLIESQLSQGIDITIDRLLNLLKIYEDCNTVTTREKIILLNRIIVYYNRHTRNLNSSKIIENLPNHLLQLLNNIDTNQFINQYYASIAYRGLAMISSFDEITKVIMLDKAEYFAKKLDGESVLDKI